MTELSVRDQLKLAQSHLDRVHVAAWPPVDWADVGNYGLYALEAAVMAAARALGVEVKPAHWSKQEAADRLADEHGLMRVSDIMQALNDTRKASNYGDVERPDLNAEDVAADIEAFLTEIERLLDDLEAGE